MPRVSKLSIYAILISNFKLRSDSAILDIDGTIRSRYLHVSVVCNAKSP